MRIINAVAVLAAFGIAGAASAQTKTLDLNPSGLSLRGGVVFPLDSKFKDVGDSLIGVGLEYLLTAPLIKGGETFLSGDYFTSRIGGDKGTVFAFTANQRWYTAGSGLRRNYFFLGAGIAFVDVNNSKTTAVARGGVGTELGDKIFAEVSGTVSGKAAGVTANSFGVYLGYRF